MTGTGAGAIDFDWLMEHVRVKMVSLEAADIDYEVDGGDEEGPTAPTFCIDLKALPAAEQFLLSRYALHEQVYFHKTTRCIEHMIALLLRRVAAKADNSASAPQQTGLPKDHPLLCFFGDGGGSLANYLSLDDTVVMGGIERMTKAEDDIIRDIACRLRGRRLYKTLDIRVFGPDEGRQRARARKIDDKFKDAREDAVLKDEGAALSIYSQVGGDDEKAHKKLRILDSDGKVREISTLSKVIPQLATKRPLTRYYFKNEADRKTARSIAGEK